MWRHVSEQLSELADDPRHDEVTADVLVKAIKRFKRFQKDHKNHYARLTCAGFIRDRMFMVTPTTGAKKPKLRAATNGHPVGVAELLPSFAAAAAADREKPDPKNVRGLS